MLKIMRTVMLAPAFLAFMHSGQAYAEVMNTTQAYVIKNGDSFYSFFTFKNPVTANTVSCTVDRTEQADKLMLYMAQGKTVDVTCTYNSSFNKYLLNVTY